MEAMENNSAADENNSEEQQNQSEGVEMGIRPSLSQVKKSWGFRRTTIARREFLDEVGDLTYSPPHSRRGRSRRTNQTTPASSETPATRRTSRAARSVIDELEWSAPSSPVSEESKPASEASAGASLDPSLWQDFGSAFHTAFSLLGGNDALPMDMSDALAVPDVLEATEDIEPLPPQAIDDPEVPENIESTDDLEISLPVASDNVSGGDSDDVVLISGHEEDSDEMTLMQIKEQLVSKSRQGDTRARGGKGGRGKARGKGRGRGRGRGKGRGRGRGRGRGVELESSTADDEDDEVMIVNPVEPQLQEGGNVNEPHSPAAIEISPPHSDISLSPAQRSSSDCVIIESDLDQTTDVTPGQYDDAPVEVEEKGEEERENINVGEYSGTLDTEGQDSNALYCICRQKQDKRFMICCDSCQEWFHGSCVGISETQGRKMEKRMQEYICPPCTTKKQSQLQPEPNPQLEPEISFPECLTLSSSGEEGEAREEQQAPKDTIVVLEEEDEEEAPVMRREPEPETEMETESSLPLCIGPSCSKQALPDSVYCGTDCILQHAALTMKTLSDPKVPKAKGRAQKKPAIPRPTAKGQRSCRMSKRLAGKAEEEDEEEEIEEDDGGQKEAASPSTCDPSLTEVQATSIPSSKSNTASEKDSNQLEPKIEDVAPSQPSPEDTPADAAPSSQPAAEPALPQSHSQEKPKEPINSTVSKQKPAELNPCLPPTPAKSSPSPSVQSPSTSAPRHHETGALMVTKTSYVIPKKQSVPQPLPSHASASTSSLKPCAAPTLVNETRNLLVPPAPSAPSSRPSQPNNQVRQSIQRSLTSILFKRVCDCEDLEMSESEVAKLVASIEVEMFDIFRNTDSKYMNKYRTIMFNLKDPRNKGLLCRVVRGEISSFRLVRMSQKDMQAIKASDPCAKETTEVKDAAGKATGLLQKPDAVKIDLPSLNPAKPDRSTEQKKTLPTPATKTKTSQPIKNSAVPDILACMLKDTTSEHKTHLFDLKCKICTGQMLAEEEEEPAKKKPKVSETREKYEPSRRKSAEEDSPLRAPPDSPDIDSPTSTLMDPSSRLIIDSPVLTIVESPASPTMDSPASPTLESPASPIMESPASPTPDTPKATTTKRAYAPVVIPAVSTVTITRRDPRTAANRFSASSTGSSGPSNTTHNQSVPYAPLKETRTAPSSAADSSLPPMKTLPKSILMKPSSSADPRLYGTSSRTVISESPADGETAQFLAKQDIVWKGFLNMLTVAKFVTKGYLVSGSAENLKGDLPDTIQIGGRILPATVWDYVAKLKTSITKELCVIRFHPATEEEEVAYVSLFSYFSSRGRFGVVANSSRTIKDLYLVPLSAKESIPSILHPLEGPGLEKKRPNLLLGLAIIQKPKRPGSLPQEVEEKRPKVHMSKDPMWIPKPPVLYGSDNLEIFQPYDPETPANTTPPGSPSCPGSPSESSSSGSVTIPSLLTSTRANPPVSTPATVAATESTSNSMSVKNPKTASSGKTPLQAILKSLFGNKPVDSTVSSEGSSATTTVNVRKRPAFSQSSGTMIDPIVQQYGQKSKVKEIEEEENDFDRPYDPEEEYDPAMGYEIVAPKTIEKLKADDRTVSGSVDDDVAYDPEDETIFADIQSVVTKPPVPTQMSDSPSCLTPVSTNAVTPAPTSNPMQTSSPAEVTENLPTGTVVVSAATLTEQQRMLEELNKQIEEQKRQLKEQEEALRQQREAVGMFMAHFSVSDSLMSPPSKSLPLSQLPSLQSGIMQTESKPFESTEKTSGLTEPVDSSNVDSQTVKTEDTAAIPDLKTDTDTVTEQDETPENAKENEKYSSAGEIEDSDVAYDPEDESLFNEIQEDVFQGSSVKSRDSSLSRSGHSASRKGTSLHSYHSRKRRLSPKRRSHRERDRHRSPSRKSQRRSPSHSQRRRERDRHRRSERDRSRHSGRDQSERQGRHRKEHARRHSHGRRRSSSSPKKKDSLSLSPKQHRGCSPQVLEKSSMLDAIKNDPDGHQLNLVENPDEDFPSCTPELLHNVKLEISEPLTSHELQKNPVGDHDDKGGGSSTQADNPPQQEDPLKSKLGSTVPLREIDPPIRDSPQSPDPEPQFMKTSTVEKNNYIKIEDPVTHTSDSVPLLNVENTSLPIGSQASISNTLGPAVGGGSVRNMDFIALDVHSPGVRDRGMIEAEKQIEGQSPGLKHPEVLGQGQGYSNPTIGSDIQCSGPEIDPVTKHPGPGMSGQCIRNPGHMGPQLYQREAGNRFPVSDMISPGIWVPGSHTQDRAKSDQGKCVRGLGTGMQCSEPNMRKSADLEPVMRSPVHEKEKFSLRGMKPEVEGPAPDVRNSDPEGEQMLVPAMTNSYGREGGSSIQVERRDPVMKGPFSDRPGLDLRSSGLREPLSAMFHPSPDTRRPTVVDERKSCESENPNGRPGVLEIGKNHSFMGSQIEGGASYSIGRGRGQRDRDESVHTGGSRSALRGRGQSYPSPDLRFPGSSFRGSGRLQRQSRHDGSPVSEEVGPRRDLDLNASIGSEGKVLRACRLSPTMTVERQGPQRGQDVPMRASGPNINYESGGSNMPSIVQDSSGPRECFKEPWPDVRAERCVRDSDMRESETRHNLRGPDMKDRSYMEPGRDKGGIGDSDTRGSLFVPHTRSLGRDIDETGPNRRDADMQGRNMQGPWLERRNEQMGQEDRGPIPNTTNPDWRGPGLGLVGPNMRGQMSQSKDFTPHMRNQDSSGLDITDDWGGPDRRGSGPVRGGPFIPGEWEVNQLDRRGSNMEGWEHERLGPRGADLMAPGPLKRGPYMEVAMQDRRGQGGPHFMGSGPERSSEMEAPMQDRRGPGGPHFMGSGCERRSSDMEVPMHDWRGSGGSDFRRPEPERRCQTNDNLEPGMRRPGGPEGPGPSRRGQGGPDSRGPWPERRGPDMVGQEADRRGPRGLDFIKPEPDWRDLSVGDPGAARIGSEGLNFSGLAPESKGPAMDGPGAERRGPRGPDFREQVHERRNVSREHPGPDSRGPGGPGFRGPGFERRSLSMERAGPDIKRPRCPDFRETGPERRGPAMEAPRSDRRGPGGPDFIEPGPSRRGPSMGGLGPDRRESGVPDFSGPGHERRGCIMDSQEPDRRGPRGPDFQGQGPERRGLVMDGPGSERRGPVGSDLRGPGCERRGPSRQGQGPDRRGPGDHNTGGQGPDRRGPHLRGPGPDFVGLGPEQTGPGMEGSGLHNREHGGSHFRGSGPESGHPNIEGPGTNRSGPGGSNMRRSGLQHSGPNIEGPLPDRRGPEGSNFRGPGPERRPSDMESPEFDRRVRHFRGVRPERIVMEGPGSDRKGSDFGGPGCESRYPDIEGLRSDAHEPGGSGFRQPGPERRGPDMEGPIANWRRSGGPDFTSAGIRQKGPITEGQRHRRDDWGGADFRGSEHIQESTHTEGPGSDRIGRNFKDPGPMRSNIRGPGPDMSSLKPDFRSSAPDRRGIHTEEQWSGDDWKRHHNRVIGPIQEGPDEQVQERGRQGPPMEWRGPGNRGPPIEEVQNMIFQEPVRDLGDDWSGSGCRGPAPVHDDPDVICPGVRRDGPGNEWAEPDRAARPNRWGPGPFFRVGRDPGNRGLGHDRRGRGRRGPGSDMRGGPDMGKDHRQPDFRSNMRGRNIEGPGGHRGGPDGGPDLLQHPRHENRNSNNEGPVADGRFLDCVGPGSERRSVDMESPGTDREGFDDFRRERRGHDMRRLGPDETDIRYGPGRWDTTTEGPEIISRGCDPQSTLFNSPHQVARFQGPSDPHSAPHSGPQILNQYSGEMSPSRLDDIQNQQAVKPQRHRAALLPTPTEGLIRFPNRMFKNPDVFSPKRKQIVHPPEREWSRGRSVSRERESVKGQRQQQEKSPAGKIRTPVDASTGDGEEKKKEDNEADKGGIRGKCVATKPDQSMDFDGNKSNVKPS